MEHPKNTSQNISLSRYPYLVVGGPGMPGSLLRGGLVLAGVPRAPGAPAAVDRVGQDRALGRVLPPVGDEVAAPGRLGRRRGALHQVLVPAAVRLLGVQAGLGVAVPVALYRRDPVYPG